MKVLYGVAYRRHLKEGRLNLRRKSAVEPHYNSIAAAWAEARTLEAGGWPRGAAVLMVWTNGRWHPLTDAKQECPT